MIDKPKLFDSRKEFIVVSFVLIVVIAIRIGIEYYHYKAFIKKPFFYTNAEILNVYPKSKNGKNYEILKLHSDNGLIFFTTAFGGNYPIGTTLRVQLFPNKRITFDEYLGYFYIKSRIKSTQRAKKSLKTALMRYIDAQHSDKNISSLYQAIFLATPINKEFRQKISGLGVSHLVALSGFHLGILWSFLYMIFLMLYRPFQQKYFPYRYSLIDVGTLVMILLGAYLYFTGMPPSLLRSYVMLLVGWSVLLMGIELVSFSFLAIVALLILALYPPLMLSISFWLSVSGVFYIFMILEYFKHSNKWLISLLLIPVGIFVLMTPITHMIFETTTRYQLLSPLLSILFIPFYPLSAILHLFGMGGIADKALDWIFSLPNYESSHILPIWLGALYIVTSIAAIRYKLAFITMALFAFGYAGYIFSISSS